MTSQLECNSRAALCRRLARREPSSKVLWMAEAEKWSRLSEQGDTVVAVPGEAPGSGHCHWGLLRPRGRLHLEGAGENSQLRTSVGAARKDPFEEFLDLMAVEDRE